MSVALFRHAVVSAGNVVTCAGSVFTAGGCLWEGPGMSSQLLSKVDLPNPAGAETSVSLRPTSSLFNFASSRCRTTALGGGGGRCSLVVRTAVDMPKLYHAQISSAT